VPCYNEEAVLPETFKRMTAIFDDLIARGKIASSSHMLFVNDGSKDATWQLIAEASETSPYIRGLKLSRNRGHQIALKLV
jgi:Glycosyltransferases involved in cell wall biogenesis